MALAAVLRDHKEPEGIVLYQFFLACKMKTFEENFIQY